MQGADLEALKAQMGAGAVGQDQIQKNLNQGVADFNAEKNYPQDQLAALIKNATSLQPPGTTYQASNVPYNPPSTSQNVANILTPLLLANKKG
jgi:hypothetical protein